MSEYMKDAGHRPMQTCDRCHGAFYCDAPAGGEAPDWTCPRCTESAAEIARVRAALKPFADIARRNELAHDNDSVDATMADCRTAQAALKETP